LKRVARTIFYGNFFYGFCTVALSIESSLQHRVSLNPFVIGFVWAGVVTIFPILFWQVQHPYDVFPSVEVKTLLWLQNFIFISALAVVFDIKDYYNDKRQNLKTYPATLGIKNTLRFIVTPLTILCLSLLICFNIRFGLSFPHTLLQSIPYLILLVLSIKSFARERSLLFYLAIIDGLMLLKGLCGIISLTVLK
jgi:4-hydroxybenzoate polyprenyltransferase